MPDKDSERKGSSGWAPVNPRIWAPIRKRGLLRRILQRILETAASLVLPVLIVLTPVSFLISLIVAYYLVGPTLLGPVLVAIWSLLVIGFVFVVEKKGYARNFQGWDYRLSARRLLALPLAAGALISILYLMFFVLRH